MNKELLLEEFYIPETKLPFAIGLFDRSENQMHWHHYWEILYQIEGKTRIKINNDDFCLHEGDVVVIGAEENHAASRLMGKHKLLVMQFEMSAIMPYIECISEDQYLTHVLFSNLGEKIHFRISEGRDIMQKLLWEIYQEYEGKEAGYEIQIQSYLLQMFAFFIRRSYLSLPEVPEERRKALKKIEHSVLYIEKNFNGSITLADAAAVSSISVYNFCRTFKKATGRTFVEFLNYIRLKEAAKLLLTTDRSISEIAFDTGFSSVSYFNKVFKKNYGYPPFLYRKENALIRKENAFIRNEKERL